MISPLENNGMVMRMQDFSTVRQNENNHSVNLHVQIQDELDKTTENQAQTVNRKNNSDGANTEHDARDEGRNKYFDTRKKKLKEELDETGIVVAKGKGGFDITI